MPEKPAVRPKARPNAQANAQTKAKTNAKTNVKANAQANTRLNAESSAQAPPQTKSKINAKTNARQNVWILLNGTFKIEEFLNGPFKDEVLDLFGENPDDSFVAAADGGAKRAAALGWPVNLLAGDLDSLSEQDLALIPRAPDFRLERYPRAKDATDFELIFPLALERLKPPGRVGVIGGLGGRWDMTLSNLLLPWAPPFRRLWRGGQLVFWGENQKIHCLIGPAKLSFQREMTLSLLPALGAAGPIALTGDVAYPLKNERLVWGLSRGVSNEIGSDGAELFLEKGSLLVIESPQSPDDVRRD
jgi:thiamine pyrophosphokinase